CFASQIRRQRYDMQIDALNRYRTYTLPSHVQAAEAYLVLSPAELKATGLERDPADLSRALQRADAEVQQALQEARTQRDAHQAAQARLDAVLASTSWRVTQPLRCAARLLRRVLQSLSGLR
ncbi:MAG: hypothetical protein KGL17_00950, partial [Betaproteobacteria bacterium]|nr:hypothetical protein [Betaproteobacteria bacterium]